MEKTPFKTLAHAVNSKCLSLCEAANILERIPPKRADKILALMADQARGMEAAILNCRQELSKNAPS